MQTEILSWLWSSCWRVRLLDRQVAGERQGAAGGAGSSAPGIMAMKAPDGSMMLMMQGMRLHLGRGAGVSTARQCPNGPH